MIGISRRAAAYHEAGHAVAIVWGGAKFDRVELFDRPRETDGRLSGGAVIEPDGWPDYFALGVSLLAGPIAQAIYTHRSYASAFAVGGRTDLDEAERTLKDDLATLLWCFFAAPFFMRAAWPVVAALAEAIDKKGVLTFAEVVAIRKAKMPRSYRLPDILVNRADLPSERVIKWARRCFGGEL